MPKENREGSVVKGNAALPVYMVSVDSIQFCTVK